MAGMATASSRSRWASQHAGELGGARPAGRPASTRPATRAPTCVHHLVEAVVVAVELGAAPANSVGALGEDRPEDVVLDLVVVDDAGREGCEPRGQRRAVRRSSTSMRSSAATSADASCAHRAVHEPEDLELLVLHGLIGVAVGSSVAPRLVGTRRTLRPAPWSRPVGRSKWLPCRPTMAAVTAGSPTTMTRVVDGPRAAAAAATLPTSRPPARPGASPWSSRTSPATTAGPSAWPSSTCRPGRAGVPGRPGRHAARPSPADSSRSAPTTCGRSDGSGSPRPVAADAPARAGRPRSRRVPPGAGAGRPGRPRPRALIRRVPA